MERGHPARNERFAFEKYSRGFSQMNTDKEFLDLCKSLIRG
jgi:hypothetical protein